MYRSDGRPWNEFQKVCVAQASACDLWSSENVGIEAGPICLLPSSRTPTLARSHSNYRRPDKTRAISPRARPPATSTEPVCRSRSGITRVILLNMKTAISIPDDLFAEAEAAARRLHVSRSELYATAMEQFLKQDSESAITKRLNEIYERHSAKLDPVLHRAQMKSLKKESW